MWRCSVKGLPVHARLPHRIGRAYSVSSSGPRTLRTWVDPGAGHLQSVMEQAMAS